MNPQQEKERYFAAHWGQKCYDTYGLLDYINARAFLEHNLYYGHLELIPLSSITDEDAIEVARILTGISINEARVVMSNRMREIRWQHYYVHLFPDLSGSIINTEAKWEEGLDYYRLPKVYDYLRLKGYALPYGNRTVEELIELGWLKIV